MKIGISILCLVVLATASSGFVNIHVFSPGVRSLGLGNSFVAVADTPEAVFANPAGLGQLRRRQATFAYWNMNEDMGQYMASFGMPLNAKLGLGLGYERIASSQISENGAFASLSYQAVRRLYVGVSAKYLFSIISPKIFEGDLPTASWVDVGLLWQSPFPGAQMGLFLKNVYQASGKKDAGQKEREVHLGAGYRVGTRALLSVQYAQYHGTPSQRRWMIGGEYYLLEGLVLRAGREHVSNRYKSDLNGLASRVWLSVGVGLRLEYRAVGLLLDYAHRGGAGGWWWELSPHRFSLACEF